MPFDQATATIPHRRGRVVRGHGEDEVPGMYVVGWIKRGPNGFIGSNKSCARETVNSLLADLNSGDRASKKTDTTHHAPNQKIAPIQACAGTSPPPVEGGLSGATTKFSTGPFIIRASTPSRCAPLGLHPWETATPTEVPCVGSTVGAVRGKQLVAADAPEGMTSMIAGTGTSHCLCASEWKDDDSRGRSDRGHMSIQRTDAGYAQYPGLRRGRRASGDQPVSGGVITAESDVCS